MLNRKLIFNILKFVVFLGIGLLLIWVITKDLTAEQKEELRNSFRVADYWWVGLSIVIGILSHYVRALRWKMMLQPLGYNPRISTTFYSVIVAYLANMAVPRLGEITRCGIVQRYEKVPFDKAVGTIVVERSIDLLMLFLVTEKFSSGLNMLLILGGSVLILVLISIFLVRRFKHTETYLRIRIMIMNVRDGIYSIRHLKNFKLFIFYSVFIWVCYFAMVWVCFYALEQTAHLGLPEALAVLVFGTVGIISTPGGIGAYHLIVTETLVALYGLDRTYAISFSWLAWSAQTVMIIFMGVISLLLLSRVTRKETVDETV